MHCALFFCKTVSKNVEHWFIYLNCIVLSGAPNWFLDIFIKLAKTVFRSVGATRAAFVEPLAHCRNAAILRLFDRYWFAAEMVFLSYSRGKSTRYSDRLHDFSFTVHICLKDFYSNTFFPRISRLRYFSTVKCFLSNDLNGFESRVNRLQSF